MSLALNRVLAALNHKPSVAEAFFYHCSHQVCETRVNSEQLGYMMRKLRLAQSVSLRSQAKRLKLSAPYLGDLELGQRGWTLAKVEQYLAALPQMPSGPQLLIR